MILPVTRFHSYNPPIHLQAQPRTPWKTKGTFLLPTRQLSRFNDIFDRPFLTVFPSDVESLSQGIIKTSEDKNKPYTILLVGEAGVGKTAFVQLIANVLVGNDTDHYDFGTLKHGKKQSGSTDTVHVYKVTSNNGIVVSDSMCEHGE
jgi:hypothetical protein